MRQILTQNEAKALGVAQFIGVDGKGYNVGDTVVGSREVFLHSEEAKVVGSSLTPNDRVHVRFKGRDEVYFGREHWFRKL